MRETRTAVRFVTLSLATLVGGVPAPAAAQSSRMPIVADNIVVQRDVIYGRPDGAAVLADIAYPETGKGLPAIVYVHGGRWTSGERVGRLQLYVEDWAKAGYFAMTIDYRLAGSAPAPAGYQDLLCAVRWLHAHAAQFNVDENRIYLAGNSSGGHVVSLAATLGDGTYERVGGWKDARSDVRAVISISGAYDLNALSWGNLWTPLNAKDVALARRTASPIQQITAKTKPMLIIHSDDDQSVPIQQALDMVTALTKADTKHKFVHYKDRGHMRLTDEVVNEMLAFIADVEGRTNDAYTGVWRLNLAKTGGEERTQTLTILVRGNQETYRSELVSADGRRQVTDYTARYDGNEYPSQTVVTDKDARATKRDDRVILKKIDDRTRERHWKQDGRIVRILRRVVSADGRVLTSQVVDVDAAGHEKVTSTLVFDKQ